MVSAPCQREEMLQLKAKKNLERTSWFSLLATCLVLCLYSCPCFIEPKHKSGLLTLDLWVFILKALVHVKL
jgi:hypothetical protein